MKKLFLIFLLAFLIAIGGKSQIVANFEDGTTGSLNLHVMGCGNWDNPDLHPVNETFMVVDNPNFSGFNTSSKVMKFIRRGTDNGGLPWAGFWANCNPQLDVTANKYVHVKVYKTRISPIKFKLEDGAAGTLEIFSKYPQTVVYGWEDIVFDFSSQTGTYPIIAFMPDFADPVGLTEDITIYFDDIVVNNDSLPNTTTAYYIENFEHIPLNIMYGDQSVDLSTMTVVTNPFPDSIDSSATVCEFLRDKDGVYWGGFWSALPTPVDVTTNKYIHVKVYKSRISPIKFKLESGAAGTLEIESKYPQTIVNGWEDIVFDFSSKTGTYPIIAFMPDYVDPVGLTEDIIIYFDDLVVNNDSLPNTIPVYTIENFEPIPLNIMYGDPSVDSSTMTVVSNPFPGGIASSEMVCKFLRDKDGAPWGGFRSELPTPIDVTTNKYIHVKVYKSRVSPIKFKLEGGVAGTLEIESKYPQTVVNGWEDIVFDFSSKTGTYPIIAFMPDYVDTVGLIEDIPIYFDDIILNNDFTPLGRYNVSGTITYANSANTPMNNVILSLKNELGSVIGTSITDVSGGYSFGNVDNGDYTLQVTSSKPWNGVSASDVLLYQKHIANIIPLTGIYFASGDVNNSGSLTASDVLLIKKRIASIISSFPSGDWLFNNGAINVNGSNVTYNFNGLVYGDANGSYIPTAVALSAVKEQGIISMEEVNDVEGEITVPVHISDMPDLGSFQFTIAYDPDKIQFTGIDHWYDGINDVTVGNSVPGQLTFVWAANDKGVNITDGTLCNIRFTTKTSGESNISFENNPTLKEFSDYDGNLFMPQFINGGIGSVNGIGEQNRAEISVYPNPSNGTFTLEFKTAQSQAFDVKIYNSLGVAVYQQLNVAANGKYSTEISLNDLPEGIYTLTVTGNHANYIKKIVIRK